MLVEAKHVVLGNSWDYEQIPLNKQPNWDLYGKLAVQGAELKAKGIKDIAEQIQSMETIGGDFTNGLFQSNNPIQDLLNQAAGQLGVNIQVPGVNPNGSNGTGGKQSEYKQKYNQELAEKKRILQEKIRECDVKIQEINAKIKPLEPPQDDDERLQLAILKQRLADELTRRQGIVDELKNVQSIDLNQLDKEPTNK